MDKPKRYIVVYRRETMLESMITDTYSLVIVVVPIVLGWAIGSIALQWIGFFFSCVALIAFIMGKAVEPCTIEEARKKLDEWEQETK